MEEHYGKTVEYIVRKNSYNIAQLAKELGINRRSMYNWFTYRDLKPSAIYRIGCVINHDFSREFPGLFESEDFNKNVKHHNAGLPVNASIIPESQWKERYIQLLEAYNNLIFKNAVKHRHMLPVRRRKLRPSKQYLLLIDSTLPHYPLNLRIQDESQYQSPHFHSRLKSGS
jgi:hypothetical protein